MNAFAGWLRESPTGGSRSGRQRSVVTIHGHFKDLRAFVRWLHEEELITVVPKVPIPKLPQTLFPVLTDDELLAIFRSRHLDSSTEIGKRNRALLLFMLDTGVRLAEVASLSRTDLHLTECLAKIWGKGSRERFVFFSTSTADTLKAWLDVRGEDEGSLFWLQPSGIRMVWSGSRPTPVLRFSIRTNRHTALTMLVRKQVGIHTVRRIAGHSSLAVTERYLSLSTQDLRDEHRAASPVDQIKERVSPRITPRRRLQYRRTSDDFQRVGWGRPYGAPRSNW